MSRKVIALSLFLVTALLLALGGCRQPGSGKATPEATKQFLKLRGYEFDEKSFLSAAAAGDVMAINGFLSAGMNPNARAGDDGDTALGAAASRGDLKTVNALLQGGADLNFEVRGGWTAFLLALSKEQDEMADALVSRPELKLEAQAPHGMSALMFASWNENGEILTKLLQRGADANHQDGDGDTALHWAAMRDSIRLAKMLLDHGANPNLANKLGGTPLMWAASYDREEITRFMLANGADPRLKDHNGLTAAAWAEKNKHTGLAKLLRAAEKGE